MIKYINQTRRFQTRL